MAEPLTSQNNCVDDLYSGLPLSTADSIRMLSINPGRYDAAVDLEMQVISLAEYPMYEALSYTWGGSREGRTVRVNKHFELPVTDNLFRALRRLRKRFTRRIIWIDAMCINQVDFNERASQVAMMGRIYSAAECVDVWIGEVVKQPAWQLRLPQLFKYFERLHERHYINNYYGDRTLMMTLMIPLISLVSLARLVPSHLRNDSLAIAQALRSCDAQYHDRLWVMQEFSLAKKRYLCFGGRRIRLDFERASFLEFEAQFPGQQQSDMDRFYLDISLFNLDISGKISILTWFPTLHRKQASNPKDKVYGILGLLPEEQAQLILPDYNQSTG